MFIVIRKLSRLVSTNLPRSSFLSEKPIAWTTKSIVSQRAFSVVEGAVERRPCRRRRNRSGSRRRAARRAAAPASPSPRPDRRKRAPRPARASALAMPQASERSLARPMISPRFPCHQAGHCFLLFGLRVGLLARPSARPLRGLLLHHRLDILSVGIGVSASAALSSAPITRPRPMMKKKISAIITPARLP